MIPKSFQIIAKMVQNRGLEEAWVALGAYRGVLVVSWGFLAASWGVLGSSWGVLGASWRALGASWSVWGASWRILAPFGGLLGRLWPILGSSWRILGRLGRVLARLGRVWARLASAGPIYFRQKVNASAGLAASWSLLGASRRPLVASSARLVGPICSDPNGLVNLFAKKT